MDGAFDKLDARWDAAKSLSDAFDRLGHTEHFHNKNLSWAELQEPLHAQVRMLLNHPPQVRLIMDAERLAYLLDGVRDLLNDSTVRTLKNYVDGEDTARKVVPKQQNERLQSMSRRLRAAARMMEDQSRPADLVQAYLDDKASGQRFTAMPGLEAFCRRAHVYEGALELSARLHERYEAYAGLREKKLHTETGDVFNQEIHQLLAGFCYDYPEYRKYLPGMGEHLKTMQKRATRDHVKALETMLDGEVIAFRQTYHADLMKLLAANAPALETPPGDAVAEYLYRQNWAHMANWAAARMDAVRGVHRS